VKGLILRGIFALRREELEFFYQGPGTSFIFPECESYCASLFIYLLARVTLDHLLSVGLIVSWSTDWKEYVSIIPVEERKDMIAAYYKRLTSDDKAVRSEAAKRWSVWECSTSRLMIDPDYIKKAYEDDFSDKFARIEFSSFSDDDYSSHFQVTQDIFQTPYFVVILSLLFRCHYFFNAGWMRDGQLLEKAEIDKIREIPAVIVQGRYDCQFTLCHQFHFHPRHKAN
jgi:proline iminopeptidase